MHVAHATSEGWREDDELPDLTGVRLIMVASLRWIYSPASSFVLSGLMKLRRSASILLANISVINWWKRSTSGVEVVCAQHDAVRIYVTGTLGLRWLKLSRFGGSVFMGTGCFVRGSVCGSAMSYPSSHRQISHGYWRASIIYALHCIAPGVKNNVLKCSPTMTMPTSSETGALYRRWCSHCGVLLAWICMK